MEKCRNRNKCRPDTYVDTLAVVADSNEELRKTLQEGNNIFRKHGFQVNLEKTKVTWIGEQDQSAGSSRWKDH